MTHVPPADRRRTAPPDDVLLLARGTDSLTGLIDRDTFLDVLQRRTLGQGGTTRTFALLMLDLDQFGEVNATHGRDTGDALLAAAARRLRGEIRAADVAGRLGGDSFGVLMPDPSSESEALGMAARLVEMLRRPFSLNGRVLSVACTIGIALHPADAWDEAGLMRCAIQAMREVKQEGGGGTRRLVAPDRPLAHPAWQRRIA